MKLKKGFTLAEVLITLTIIGVVAVLTLPALLTNTQEQQAKTALRKMANTMTNVAALGDAIDGYNYDGLSAASSTATVNNAMETTPSLLNLFATRASINRSAAVINKANQNIKALNYKAVFNDGTCVYFTSSETSFTKHVAVNQPDGLNRGFVVIFDTNGDKGPNKLSNCMKTHTTISALSGDDAGDCTNKNDRFLKDQYLMALRGTKVDPIGAASVYLMTDAVGTIDNANKYDGKDWVDPTTKEE